MGPRGRSRARPGPGGSEGPRTEEGTQEGQGRAGGTLATGVQPSEDRRELPDSHGERSGRTTIGAAGARPGPRTVGPPRPPLSAPHRPRPLLSLLRASGRANGQGRPGTQERDRAGAGRQIPAPHPPLNSFTSTEGGAHRRRPTGHHGSSRDVTCPVSVPRLQGTVSNKDVSVVASWSTLTHGKHM